MGAEAVVMERVREGGEVSRSLKVKEDAQDSIWTSK